MAEFEKSLERYDVLDRIAIGGMAEVFLAKAHGAHGFEKTLAIKRILPELARDPEFEARFIAEAKVAVKLSHANIVQVLDFGRFAGSLFIAMEFVDGLDLAALLRRFRERGEQVPLSAAFHIAIEIARGLDFAHQHGVVHRDVSPSNILLSRAGEVKIADFGIAVAAAPHRSVSGSGPRKVMGKWRYMSPEQARGEILDTRSDLFSAASVMYELFTGEKLFPGDEAEEILKNIESMAIPPASAKRPGLPARLDEILASALQHAPNDRPARAAVVLRALTELSYESSIVATPLDVSESVQLVLEPGAAPKAGSLDDIIRKQLFVPVGENAGGDTAGVTKEKRKTAVNTRPGMGGGTGTGATADATGVFMHTVDADGVSRLDGNGEGEATTMAGQPRSRRTTGMPIFTNSSGLPFDMSASGGEALDPDRRTEVGSPLDESRPLEKLAMLLEENDGRADPVRPKRNTMTPRDSGEPTAANEIEKPLDPVADKPFTRAATPAPVSAAPSVREPARDVPAPIAAVPVVAKRSSRKRAVVVGAGVVGSAALAWLFIARSSSHDGKVPASDPGANLAIAPSDASVAMDAAATGTIQIDSIPSNAHGTVGKVGFATTPAKLVVPADVPLTVTVEAAGFERYVDDRVVVPAGQVVRVRAQLVVARAHLHVTSAPTGATVLLDGRVLGKTPLTRDDLEPHPGAVIEVARPQFQSMVTRVDLVAGRLIEINRDLKAAVKFGTIDLFIDGGWADIYNKGKVVGRAPAQGLRLPVGHTQLRLFNPMSKRERLLDVDVVEGKTNYYRTTLPQ